MESIQLNQVIFIKKKKKKKNVTEIKTHVIKYFRFVELIDRIYKKIYIYKIYS